MARTYFAYRTVLIIAAKLPVGLSAICLKKCQQVKRDLSCFLRQRNWYKCLCPSVECACWTLTLSGYCILFEILLISCPWPAILKRKQCISHLYGYFPWVNYRPIFIFIKKLVGESKRDSDLILPSLILLAYCRCPSLMVSWSGRHKSLYWFSLTLFILPLFCFALPGEG